MLAYWIAFGLSSYAAGARFSVNPVAFFLMFGVVLAMTLREWSAGLHEGSALAEKIWKTYAEELHEKLRKV